MSSRCCVQGGGRTAAVIAIGFFALDPYLAKTAVGGMESSLFLLCTAVAVFLAIEENWVAAASLSAFTYFVRPEALIVMAVLLVYAILRTRKVPYVAVGCGLGILLLGIAVEYWYYGNLIPQSVVGKFGMRGQYDRIFEVAIWPSRDPIQSALTVTSLCGLPFFFRMPLFVRLYASFGLLILLAWFVTSAYIWAWYAVPVYLTKCLLSGCFFAKVFELVSSRREFFIVIQNSLHLFVLAGTILLWVAILLTQGPDPVRRVHERIKEISLIRDWKNEAAYGIDYGAFGYYSRVRVKDGPALVYPLSQTKYNNSGKQIVEGEKPEWAFITVVRDEMEWMLSSEMLARYEPVWRASEQGNTELVRDVSKASPEWSHDFMLFKRRDFQVDTKGWN